MNGYGPAGQYSEEKSYSTQRHEQKIPIKLFMDPRGIVQDVHTQGITYDHSSGMLSPDKCAELVSALHTDAPKGKGFYNANLTQKIQMNAHLIYIQFGIIPITH